MKHVVLPGLQTGDPQQNWKDDDGRELDSECNDDDQNYQKDRNMSV
jgi:hypothetical protein